MMIEDVISVIIICVMLVIFLALMAFALISFLNSREGSRMVRMLKGSFSTILSCMSPPTPLQKEIRNEEWTIKQLKKQKADMQRLEALTKEREALFEEVGDRHVEDARVRLTRNIVGPDGMTHQNTYFCYRCEKNKTLNMMSKENSIILICKECEEEIK